MITSPLSNVNKGKKLSEEDLSVIHHRFMVVYGWIPLDEFRSIPLPTLLSLTKQVNEEYAKMEQIRLSTMSIAGVKNPK